LAISRRVRDQLETLGRAQGEERRRAASAIQDLGEDYFVGEKLSQTELDALLAGMQAAMTDSTDDIVKGCCLRLVGDLPLHGEAAMAIVAQGLRDEADAVARAALYASSRLGAEARPLADLIMGLRDRSDPGIRRVLGWTIAEVGFKATEAVDLLLSLMRDKDRTTAGWAVRALKTATPDDRADVVKHVARALKHKDGSVKGEACRCVAHLPGVNLSVVKRLEKIAKSDPIAMTRYDAAMAIVDIGPPARRAFAIARVVLESEPGLPFTSQYLERLANLA